MDIHQLFPFLLYFLVIILIGILSTRFSSRGLSAFFLGDRKMPRLVVAISTVVSGRSAWLLVGVTGLAYQKGLVAIWAVIGYIVVEYLLLRLFAPKLRRYSEIHDCITIPDFFASRFNDERKILRMLMVAIFLIFMTTYVAAQFLAGGKAFAAHFNVTTQTGLIITASLVLIYTILGGFLAVSLTDVFQGFFMLFALVLLPVTAIVTYSNNPIEIASVIKTTRPGMFNMFNEDFIYIIGLIGIGMGSPGNPHILVRYMSIKDPRQFRWTANVATITNVIMAIGAILIGLIARAYFPNADTFHNSDPENAYITLASNVLDSFTTGLILASIFAAIMSTADSQLLVAASGIIRDLYQKVLIKGSNLSDKQLSAYSRISVFCITTIAVILALQTEDTVLWFVLFAWAGLGAAIGPTSLLAIFWKKTTYHGAISGLITGAVIVFVWKLNPILDAWMYELIPAFIISFIVTFLVSYLQSRRTN